MRGKLSDLVERSLKVPNGEPMVFFLGAGASAAAPSCMPQPWPIQTAAFDCVVPPGAESDRDFIASSLPEIYHEVLLEVGGEETRQIWSALSLWESGVGSRLQRFSLRPNLIHLLSAYLAWKSATPLVTVNFDQMLERAVSQLGLNPAVSLEARTETDTVALWKLHGTVDDLSSIRTTLQAITASNPQALRSVRREFDRAAGCLIGYSGRDIDFFPFICDWSPPQSVFWLTLGLEETAYRRFSDPFVGIDANAEDWARAVVARLPDLDEPSKRLKREAQRSVPDRAEVKAVYEQMIPRLAERVYGPLFPSGSSKRILAHAMALAALGRNADAERWVDRFLKAPEAKALETRGHLLKSALCHEGARYRDSEHHALLARQLAEDQGLAAAECEAALRVDEAKRMLYALPRLPFAGRRDLLSRRGLGTLAAMLLDAWRFRRWRRSRDHGAMLGYADLRARFEYLEHLVRLGALVQGAVERLLPSRVSHRLLPRYWRWLEARCYEAGYALGIGNAKKFELRQMGFAQRETEVLSVANLYELVPSPTGSAIHHRDVAEVAARETGELAPGSAREAKRGEAIALFDRALADARRAGDPSLELKIMLGMKGADPTVTWSDDEVRDLLAQIQSPAFEAFGEQIVEELTR